MNIQAMTATLKASTQNSTPSTSSGTDFSPYLKSTTLDDIFQKAADTYQVPVNLLKAIGLAESSFHVDATSRCGAQGIMQLMPKTAKALGVTDSYDPEQNIMGGAKYISDLLKNYKGDASLALAAYNAGSNNVKKYGGIPPFKETQNYVKKVMENYQKGVTIPASRNNIATTGSSNSAAPILQNNTVTVPANQTPLQSNTVYTSDALTELSKALDQATSFSFSDYGNFIKAYFQGLTNSTFLEEETSPNLEQEMDTEIKKVSEELSKLADKSTVTEDDYKQLDRIIDQINSGLQLRSSDLYKSYQNIQYNPAIMSLLASDTDKSH